MLYLQSCYVDVESRHRYSNTTDPRAESGADVHASAVAGALAAFPKGDAEPPAAVKPEGVAMPYKFDEYVVGGIRHALWSTPEAGMGEGAWRTYHSAGFQALTGAFPLAEPVPAPATGGDA
jgi:hypothetical protein